MEQLEPVGMPRSRGALLYVMATVAALYLARELLIPVAMAVLLSFILSPVVSWIESSIRSRIAAVAIVTVAVVGVAGGGLVFVGAQFAGLAEKIPEYRETVVRKAKFLGAGPTGLISRVSEELSRIGHDVARTDAAPAAAPAAASGPDAATEAPSGGERTASGGAGTLLSVVRPIFDPLASSAIVLLLLVMMLMSRESIRNRVIRLAGLDQLGPTTHALDEAGARIGRYLRSLLLVNTIYGAVVGGGLLAVGVPNALLCGVMAGALRFIPVVGPWLGAAIPTALALAVFDDWGHLILVLGLFAGCEIIANAVLEPWLYGASTGLSGFGLVLALIFWTWVWGPVGLVLAVPLTVCVVVFGRYVPALSFLWVLLANDPVLVQSVRYYQRLLSRDEEEAAAILASAKPDADPAAVLDEVVLPALGAARRDQVLSLISTAQARAAAAAAGQVALEWLSDLPMAGGALEPTRTPVQVVCLPASDVFDAAAAGLLVELLRREGVGARAVSAELLFSERVAAARTPDILVAVVASVEHATELHARRTCRALRRGATDDAIAVVSWGGRPPGASPAAAGGEEPGMSRAASTREAVAVVRSLLAVRASSDSQATARTGA